MKRLVAIAALGLAAAPAAAPADPGRDAAAGPGLSVPAPVVEAEAPVVSAAVSSQEVVLGSTFSLFVRVVYQPGVQVNLPAVLPLGPSFEESARSDSTQVNADGTITRDFEVALVAFDVGEQAVPPIPVTYAAQGRAREVATEPVPIRVKSFIGDGEANLLDIAGPLGVERRDYTPIYVAVGVGLALLALSAGLAVRRVLRRRRREVLARLPDAVQRSAHDEALARLNELESSDALDAEDLKPAYLAMSEILRLYIGRRFGFPALDLTTVEIRRELQARPAGAVAADLVTGWLERADLVKFAGYRASHDEARQALYDARIFIDRTRAGAEPLAAAEEPPAAAAEAGA